MEKKFRLEEILVEKFYKLNEEKIAKVKSSLQEHSEKWLLCLGAGVSQSCKLPGWNNLLSRMMARILSLYPAKEIQDEVIIDIGGLLNTSPLDDIYQKKLKNAYLGEFTGIMDGIDSLEVAEYISEFIDYYINNEDSEKNETESLKEEKRERYITKLIQDCCKKYTLYDKTCRHNKSTLEAVAYLMKNSTNVQIKTALTYNYDNLLEEGLRKYGGMDESNIISVVPDDKEKFDPINPDQRKVFHIHGRIPIVGGYETERKQGKIILTETTYYEEERNGYSLANVLQSYSMTNYNLLYIGFSGSDYSFRRIIRGLDKERENSKHYIFFCVDDIVKSVIETCCKEEIAADNSAEKWKEVLYDMLNVRPDEYIFEKVLINHLLKLKTRYWEKHGLNVIWSTIDELPDYLVRLVE